MRANRPALLLLLPAALALVFQQVIPAVLTLVRSITGAGWSAAEMSTAWEALTAVGTSEVRQIAWTAAIVGVLVAAGGTVVGLLLGVLLRRAPLRWRRAGLALLCVSLLAYGPGSMSLAWYETPGLLSAVVRGQLTVLPLVVLLGALVGALARTARLRLACAVVIAVGGTVLAVLGERGMLAHFGTGGPFDPAGFAAVSVLIGLGLAALGLGAGLLLHAARPRFELERPQAAAATSTALTRRGILAVVSCAVVLTVLVILALPWLSHTGDMGADVLSAEQSSTAWVGVTKSTLEVLLTVLVTGAAAFGLGYLRVLGRHGRTVLLALPPWFFVGWLPLLPGIVAAIQVDPSRPPFYGLTVQLLCVPLLFVLTSLADGLRQVRRFGRPAGLVAPAALVVLSSAIMAVVRNQDLLWDLGFYFPGVPPGPAWVVREVQRMTLGQAQPLGLITPIPVLLLDAVVCGAAAALVPGLRLVSARRAAAPGPEPSGSGRR